MMLRVLKTEDWGSTFYRAYAHPRRGLIETVTYNETFVFVATGFEGGSELAERRKAKRRPGRKRRTS